MPSSLRRPPTEGVVLMESQLSVRTKSENASRMAMRRKLALRLSLAAAFALFVLITVTAVSAPASAGWAQTNCPLRYVEVDDDYPASSLINCQFKTLLEVELLPLSSGDTVLIYNGSYLANWTMSANGISVVGESQFGVTLYSTAPLATPISVQAQDINLTKMKLVGSTLGLDVSTGAANRTTLTNLTLQGNLSWVCNCHGANTVMRNITGINSIHGIYSNGAGFDADGLSINTTGATQYKLVLGGPNQRVSNATFFGTFASRAGIYIFNLAANISLTNVTVDQAVNGVWYGVSDTRTVLRDVHFHNVTYGLYFAGDGTLTIDGFDVWDATYGLYTSSGTPQVSVNRGRFQNLTNPIYWNLGGLNLTNSTFLDNPGVSIEYYGPTTLNMANVSINNSTSWNAVNIYTTATWVGGSVSNVSQGIWLDWGATGFQIRGVNFSFVQSSGLTAAGTITDLRVENCNFSFSSNGVQVYSYSYNAYFANNTFVNLTNGGSNFNGELSTWHNNTYRNTTYPFGLYLTSGDYPQNWHNITTDNTIDGKPIYYIANRSNVVIPSNASMVLIFNSSNVTVSGINQSTLNSYAVSMSMAINVTVSDSRLLGDVGVYADGTVGLRITNVTVLSQYVNEVVYFYNSKNLLVDGLFGYGQYQGGYGLYLQSVTNVTVRNVLTYNAASALYIQGSSQVACFNTTFLGDMWNGFIVDSSSEVSIDGLLVFNVSSIFQYSDLVSLSNALVINSTSVGFQGYATTRANLTNVTALNAASNPLYLDSSNNWTVRNSTFAAENTQGAYLYNSPDFRTYNSTYVSINSSSMYLDTGDFALIAIHNNFYGGAISNANSYGTWDAGYPGAGNYYSWAAPAFLDKFTGAGQNSVLGMDGIKDAPPYAVAPAKNDNYALMDPWPPAVTLTSPPDGSLIKAGTALNFSVSNFFDAVTWADNVTGNGSLAYPHDINTTGWADGWHTVTIRATDSTILNRSLAVPNVTRSYSFEFDSTGPLFSGTPALGTNAIQQGAYLNITVTDAHLFAWRYTIDGTPYNNTTLPWSINTGNVSLGLGPGNHTIVLFANDTLNNSRTFTWNFYIDGAAPLLSRTGPSSDYFQPGTMITYDATDDHNLTAVAFVATALGAQLSQLGNLVFVGPGYAVDTTAFQDGCYDLTVNALDEAGHLTQNMWTFCTDNTNPVLSGYLGGFSLDEDALYTFDGSLVQELDSAPAYEWSFDDSIVLSLTTLTGSAPTWTFDTPGMYNIHLKVTDRASNFAEVDFTLTVNDITNPVADFALNATYPEDLPITLDGSASTDNDAYWDNGNTGTFSWDIIGENYTDSVGGMVVDYTILQPGWYNITLYVWDATLVNVGTLTREVRIIDTTPPTISVAGYRGPYNETDTVTLDASASTDNDIGSPLAFSWRFTYNSNPVVLTGALFNYTFVTPGAYAVTLHVTDRTGVENTTQIALRINDVPAIGNASINTISTGAGYEWPVKVVDSDTGDTWTFTLLSGPAGMTISPAGVVGWQTTADSYGVYGVSLRVSDGIAWVDFGYVLTVTRAADPNNHAPFFTSFPVQTALPSTSYAYTVVYGDPDASDHLSLVLASGPAGMAFDNDHVLRWIIPADGSGVTYTVSLLLSDGLANVYQNFTIRARPNDIAPVFTAGKVPTTASVDEGKNYTLVIDSSFATDQDDTDFGLLLFFASAADGSTVGVTLEKTSATQWTLTLTGVKPGTTQVTLRVADPSGLSATAPIAVTVVPGQTATPSGAFPLLYLLLAAALGGAGVVALVMMRRRKKGDEAPVAGGAAPPALAPAATQVVVPASPPAAKAEVVDVDVVSVPAIAVGAAAAATAGAALAAVPSPKPKAATYVVEGLFVIYADGRMIYSKTDIGRESLGDPELVSSMFTAVQQFIKDSFSAEGELNKMGYGENQIVIERGKSVFMATINFGEPDKELQETMQTACEKMEYAYAGIIEKWDGNAGSFQNLDKIVAPILALTSGITRQDVLAATTTRDVKVLSQLEFFQGFVRLKVGIKNDTEAVITKVTLDIDFNEDVLRLQRIEPASYKTSGARVMLNVLNPGEKSSVAFYFDPQICTETNIDGIVRFRDYKGVLSSVTMKTRKAEVVCPLFFTKEHANTAMLKRLIENELQEKDSKIYTITKLPPYVKYKDIFDVAKSVVLSHDVHMVREFVSYNPFSGEAWFYGETKVKNYKIVIRAAVREDNTIEFFAASTVIKAVTGLLAEFNHTLVSMIVERYSDVKIEQVYDEATKHAIQSKALVDKLGESEAGAGETEQPR